MGGGEVSEKKLPSIDYGRQGIRHALLIGRES